MSGRVVAGDLFQLVNNLFMGRLPSVNDSSASGNKITSLPKNLLYLSDVLAAKKKPPALTCEGLLNSNHSFSRWARARL